MKKILFIFIALSSVFALIAQPINRATYDVMIETAEEAEAKHDYYNALEWYEKAYEEKNVLSLAHHIAHLQEKLRDYRKAERTFARVIRKDKKEEYPNDRFHYGRMLKMNGKYSDAIEVLQNFIANATDETIKELAQIELTGAEMEKDLQEVNGVTIEHAGKKLNSNFSEYSPVLLRGGQSMYFSGFNRKEVIILDEKEDDYHAKIYKASKSDKGWGEPTELDTKINREGYHTSNNSISPDGNRMYFTRSLLDGNIVSESKIYESVGGDGSWGAANMLEGINGNYLAKHPAIGELFGNEVLFFVSNMDGGYGGFDVYYATRKGDGLYSEPVNLGPKINTIGNEETPFYKDGTLYFSSTGHPGIGGFDLFSSVWNGAIWSEPLNMGKGYNTQYDERYLTFDEEGYHGFLVSNREGTKSTHGRTCCDDIFTVEISRILADVVVGTFDKDKKPLLGANVQLIEMTNNRMGDTKSKDNETGNVFNFNLGLEKAYAIVATRKGYYPDTVQLNTVGLVETTSYEKRLYLEKMPPPPPPEPEYTTITTEQPIVLENILYKFDDDKIQTEAEQDLQVVYDLMNQYPDMVIELGSHTDVRGNDDYNADLSQRRADSARRWLIRKGIPRARIQTNGYGESVPQTVTAKVARTYSFLNEGDVLTEEFINALPGEDAQEAAHQLNRRTEFKIISGPTSIQIKTQQLKKRTSETQQKGNNRNSAIAPANDSIRIHEFSSLYGRKQFKGIPLMEFKERIVDFGTVKKGEKRHHVYEFTNRGDVDLEIEIITACDCTTLDWTQKVIQPGETGIIDAVFDSSEKDYGETIDIDIILKNVEPETDLPIIERVQYVFEIEK